MEPRTAEPGFLWFVGFDIASLYPVVESARERSRRDHGMWIAGIESNLKGEQMSSVGRVTEISARSDKSFDDAVQMGVDRANKTLRNVTSAWVKEQRCEVTDGKIVAYQVNLLVTFVLED